MTTRVIAGVLLATVVGALGLPLVLWGWLQADRATLRGLRVDGAELPQAADPTRWIGQHAQIWLDTPILVTAGDARFSATRRELGARIDTATVTQQVRSLGHQGHLVNDLQAWYWATTGKLDVHWPVTVDEPTVAAYVGGLGPSVTRAPVPGLEAGGEGTSGSALDIDTSVHALLSAVRLGTGTARLTVDSFDAADDERLPSGISFDVTVATYLTKFQEYGGHRSRARNVHTAAVSLHGAVIAPGEVLSFNDRVGPRTYRNGYRMAHVISGGEITDGMGGGTCQVASTLHAAAFFGGLEMVEHQAHSRPSTYIPMGLDATVVWPDVDLKIRNPFPFPVTVSARAATGELTIELLGAAQPRQVAYERRVLSRSGFSERIVEDPALALGSQEVTQEGIRGARVERTRQITEHGRTSVVIDEVRYPPTSRIVRVGTGAPSVGAVAQADWMDGPNAVQMR